MLLFAVFFLALDWFYDSPPPKNDTAVFLKQPCSWLLNSRKDALRNAFHAFPPLQQKVIGRWRRGGKGHRISGDTVGSWFQERRFR